MMCKFGQGGHDPSGPMANTLLRGVYVGREYIMYIHRGHVGSLRQNPL